MMIMTEDQDDMIQDCLDRDSKLNSWELVFLDNIMDNHHLTEKQDEKLTQIWKRVTK